MKVAIPKEKTSHEKRVAASSDTVKKMIEWGLEVSIEKEAGLMSAIRDQDYQKVGACMVSDYTQCVQDADVILKVQRPVIQNASGIDEFSILPENSTVIGLLAPYTNPEEFQKYLARKINTHALEFVPRITRAQSMDVLSSQSNLAGYQAVIEAAVLLGHAFPMMMTAAGTVAPARVLILGAGVAGLQAIATARRLGAIVSAFDVRAAAKEQVESLGARFISVESEEKGEGSGGYAKEMSATYQKQQSDKIQEAAFQNDIIITTALIPGKIAPRLITKAMIEGMKEGSVIIDMAVESGGNVEGSELTKVVEKNGVKICGYAHLPSRIARDATALYARNVLNFLMLLLKKEGETFKMNLEDEIIQATTLTLNGKLVHPHFQKDKEKKQ